MEDKCAEDSASFLSRLTFWWFNPIIAKGYKTDLIPDDFKLLIKNDYCNEVLLKFDKIWIPIIDNTRNQQNSKLNAPKINISIAIVKTFWPSILLMACIKLLASVMVFANVLIFNELMHYLNPNSTEQKSIGYLYASLMLISPIIESILNNQYEFGINRISMRARVCILSAIYKKCLSLSSIGRKTYNTGKIVNLISIDVQRVMDIINNCNRIWSALFQLFMALYLLYKQIGISAMSGLLVIIIISTFSFILVSWAKKLGVKILKVKDMRGNAMNELLNFIKIVKLYAWENAFRNQILRYRKEEMKSLIIRGLANSCVLVGFSANFFVGLASFATFTLIDSSHVLDANKAFVSLSLFNIIRIPFGFLPIFFMEFIQYRISEKRINEYLNCEEIDVNVISHENSMDSVISIENGCFAWSSKHQIILNNISLKIQKNSLIAVVGQVGSGKSSLLNAILGEMEILSGKVNTFGSIAYVPQEAWIQTATLRQNIVFLNKFDEKKFQKVIKLCALDADIEMFAARDMTEIGEKGINLSGGQKQRVSLARAVYSDSDIYLFDDPLSAVDANVGQHIFDNVIGVNGVLCNKTRVLVTHRISVLPYVDEIIVMTKGFISECGTFDQLIDNKGDFSEFIAEYLIDSSESNNAGEDLQFIEEMSEKVKPILERQKSIRNSLRSSKKSIKRSPNIENKNKNSDIQIQSDIIKSEKIETGSVKFVVYKKFVQSFGIFFALFSVIFFLVTITAQFCHSLWLSEWTNDSLDFNKTNDHELKRYRVFIYGLFGSIEVVSYWIAILLLTIGCLRGVNNFHNRMIDSVLKAPMCFFDTTPIGRILNRFSKDVDAGERELLTQTRLLVMNSLRVIISIIIIGLQSPLILIAILPIVAIYYKIQRIFIATSRQLKRLDSITCSPIFEHFSETINGITSIRAYRVSDRFTQQLNRRVDKNHACFYPSFTSNRWLAVRLEFLGNCLVFVTTLFAVYKRKEITPGIAGLSITYALNITIILRNLVSSLSDIEKNIVAIERCYEYTQIPSEADYLREKTKPGINWPEKGVIKFINYSARYRDGLDLVLKNINVEIIAREKVGIVGRTGAGKSSLTLALFRLIEPINGTIIIDNVDVTNIGLYDLRSNLSVIPQDSAIFNGSLRMNLDPFGQYTDEHIWKVLELANLKDFVNCLEDTLSYTISDGGENLSVGQKQLFCLARALLRKTKILVLDEATAAVDMETDAIIQSTIRNEFKDSTIITIAHRLNTVMDYDRVIVMDNGLIVEIDTTNALLSNQKSLFYSMAKRSGLI